MALNNENNPSVAVVHLGGITADNPSVPAIHFQRKTQIKSVKIVDGAGIVASNSNFISVSLLDASNNVIAEMDTRAAEEGALVALVAKDLNVDSNFSTIAANSDLHIDYEETGTVGMTDAKLLIEYFVL